jgi:pantoate--beta-alanine ligase
MIVCHTVEDLKTQILDWKQKSETIGFVPTMGFLHAGHLRLVEESKQKTKKTVISIFVNPAQFNDPEDYLKYPIDTEGDLKKCEDTQVDLVFLPTKEVIYPQDSGDILMTQEKLQKNLCGRTRPGHFEGVMLVVAKLFHLVEPDHAFFGLKDFQQYRIIEDMVRLLNFPLQVHGVETLREPDGVAMSSRNVRLNVKERETASLIPRMFALADKLIQGGEKNGLAFSEILGDFLLSGQNIKIDYLETVDPKTLQEILTLEQPFLLAVALFVGNTRLIDNRIFYPK